MSKTTRRRTSLHPVRAGLVALGALVVWLLAATPALAATFNVNTPTDAVDDNLADGVCHTAANQCSLRAAIQQANALAAPAPGDPHIVSLPAGTFTLTIAGRDETAGATGDMNL